MQRVAQDTLRNGRFMLRVTPAASPEKLGLASMSDGFPNSILDVWTAPGKEIAIAGHDKLLRIWTVESDIPEQQETNLYIEAIREYESQRQESMAAYMTWIKKLATANEEERKTIRDSLDHYRNQSASLQILVDRETIQWMEQRPITTIWMNMLEEMSRYSQYIEEYPYRSELLSLHQRLPAEERSTEQGQRMAVHLFPPEVLELGDELTDGELFDPSGTTHRLSEYKGKYLLIDFWTLGCAPCRKALPEMKEVSTRQKDNLTMISINLDPLHIWKEQAPSIGITWTDLNDGKGTAGIAASYGVDAYPCYFLFSPEGRLLHSWRGYADGIITTKVNEWVK